MRTLVLGLPLPPVTFDNSSFLSAPSLFDYGRVIVETSALSEAIEQVTAGSTEHRTYGGLTVVNGPGGPAAFSLAELLRLRRPGAGGLLARGAITPCFAYPDVSHEGIRELPGWRRYDWLPGPDGFSYGEHLLAGDGKLGGEVAGPGHALLPP